MNDARGLFVYRPSAGEILQSLVTARGASRAQHCLHGFAEDFPGATDVGCNPYRVRATYLIHDPALARQIKVWPTPRQHCANTVESVRSRCQRDTAAFREMFQQRVGDAEVAFRILEVDGFTLCGIVDEPTSPATARWRRYPSEN